jgi:beta-phosphoglucomutase-like phosphatase (HAD superfamily)
MDCGPGFRESHQPYRAGMPLPAALLIDLDGTLLDTEPLHFEAHTRFLATKGIIPTQAELVGNIGKGDVEFYTEYMQRTGLSGDPVAWVAEKTRILVGIYGEQGVRIHAGGAELLEFAFRHGVPCMIVTSSERALARAALQSAGLEQRLTMRICREDTIRHKPHPEPYLLACMRLGLPAQRCQVIEDSPSGIASARTAGCPVVAVTGHIPDEALLLAGAQRVLTRLDDVLSSGH